MDVIGEPVAYCVKCGRPSFEGASFCGGCGARIVAASPVNDETRSLVRVEQSALNSSGMKDEDVAPPTQRGWYHRPGDPAGVKRWHTGVSWSDKTSGGTSGPAPGNDRVSEQRLDLFRSTPNGQPTRIVPAPRPVAPSRPSGGRRSFERHLDAFCYAITGVALLIAAAKAHTTAAGAVVGGLFCLGYALYIAVSGKSYWVSSLTYVVPLLGLLFLLFA